MNYTFQRNTFPIHVGGLTPPEGVPLPTITVDTSESQFELGAQHLWIVVQLRLPTSRGHSRRPVSAGVMMFPHRRVWLDAAGEQALARVMTTFGLDDQPKIRERYADAVLAEIVKATALAVVEHNRRLKPDTGKRSRARKMPRRVEGLIELLELDRRVDAPYTTTLEGGVIIGAGEVELVFGSDFEDDERPTWFWYVQDYAGKLLVAAEDIASLAELRDIANRWLGALSGAFALTREPETSVRRRQTGQRGTIIALQAPTDGHERRSYIVEWDAGETEAGLFDRDLDDDE